MDKVMRLRTAGWVLGLLVIVLAGYGLNSGILVGS